MTRRTALSQIVAFWLLLVAKVALARWLIFGVNSSAQGLAADALFILFVLVVADALFPDHRFAALATVDAVFSVVMLATVLYTGYYGQMPTAGLLRLAAQVPAVSDSVVGLLHPVHLLFVVDLVAMAVLALPPVRRRLAGADAGEGSAERTYRYQHVAVYAVAVVAVVVWAFSLTAVARMREPVDGVAAARTRGVFAFQVASALPRQRGVSSTVDLADAASVQREIERLRGGTAGKRLAGFAPGAYAGSNVIIVQVEALQALAMQARVGGRDVTPNLNGLAARSWYFPNAVSQFGPGNTADAEFALNASLYPSWQTAASLSWPDRAIPSLPRVLRQQGYEAVTFHTNTARFWNRSGLYPALGFDRYYDREFFGDEDVLGLGPSDEVLYRKVLPELVERDGAGKRFLAEIITLTSHAPFDWIPEDRLSLKVPASWNRTQSGRYLRAINYADDRLGVFLEELERSGLAADSVIVVVGDHYALEPSDPASDESAVQQELFGRRVNELDMMNVPLIVHLPGQAEGQLVEDPAALVDVMPTLADALGLDLAATPHFGRDVFVRAPMLIAGARVTPVGSYVDQNVLFMPGTGFDDGRTISVTTKRPTRSNLGDPAKWERVRGMLALSNEYSDQLPKRPDYREEPAPIIPR